MRVDVLLVSCFGLCSVAATEAGGRDKRTIDFVIRGLADTFGYDVQKRPSAIAPTRAAPASTPVPPAPRSTFFPPPVAPLPRTLPGAPTFTVRLFGGSQAAAPAAPAAAAAPAAPPAANPSKPMPALPGPRKPGPRPAPPASAAPSSTSPAPTLSAPAQRPLLRENVMKTFNVAFNYNRDLNTVPPPAPPAPPASAAPAPPASSASPPRPPPTPATKNTLRPPPPAKPVPTQAPLPAPPQTLPPVATPRPPPKPQLYHDDYDSLDASEYDDKQHLESDEYDQPEPVNYDYKNLLRQEEQQREPSPSFEDSRERFKQSLGTFWAGSPYLQLQNTGYKYLAENNDNEGAQEVPNPEAPSSKYEDYEILNDDYQAPSQPKNQKQQKFILYKAEYTPEDESDQQNFEEAEESQKLSQKRRPSNQDVEPSKKDQIVNKIIRDFKTFERQRKNLPPDPDDLTPPIKLREKERRERERQRNIKQRTKDAIQKKINKGKGFVEPAYTGVINAPIQELYQNDYKRSWPSPFDIDHAASDERKQFRRAQREAEDVGEFKSFYQPENYEIEEDYKEPEATAYDYSQLEKLHEFDDASLSANAHIENRGFEKFTEVRSIGIQVNPQDPDNSEAESSYQQNLTKIFEQLKGELLKLHSHVLNQNIAL